MTSFAKDGTSVSFGKVYVSGFFWKVWSGLIKVRYASYATKRDENNVPATASPLGNRVSNVEMFGFFKDCCVLQSVKITLI